MSQPNYENEVVVAKAMDTYTERCGVLLSQCLNIQEFSKVYEDEMKSAHPCAVMITKLFKKMLRAWKGPRWSAVDWRKMISTYLRRRVFLSRGRHDKIFKDFYTAKNGKVWGRKKARWEDATEKWSCRLLSDRECHTHIYPNFIEFVVKTTNSLKTDIKGDWAFTFRHHQVMRRGGVFHSIATGTTNMVVAKECSCPRHHEKRTIDDWMRVGSARSN